MKNPGLLCFAVAAMVSVNAAAERHIIYDYGTVIESSPIVRHIRVSTPREECWEEDVVYRHDHGGDDVGDGVGDGVGIVVGALVGGAIGNAVGHRKKNKRVGAVLGAVLGGTLGNAIARENARENRDRYASSYTDTEEVCKVYYDYHDEARVIGYKVRYRYNSETYSTRTDVDPGDTIKLRLALSPVI